MPVRWLVALWSAALLVSLPATQASTQDSAPAPAQSSSSAPATTSKNAQRYSHANDFLIRGTVLTNHAISFPGVQLRIRRSGEKKFRWEDRTNSRGEFAIRVPQGSQYEMVVRAKGFADQARTIDAHNGAGQDNVVFRMEPVKGGRK